MTREHPGNERRNASGTGAESHGIVPEPTAVIPAAAQVAMFLKHGVNIGDPHQLDHVARLLETEEFAYCTDPEWIAERRRSVTR